MDDYYYLFAYLIELVAAYFFLKYSIRFFKEWFSYSSKAWPAKDNKATAGLFVILPVVCSAIVFYTLKVLAAFDVVDDIIYLIGYMLFGMAWFGYSANQIFKRFDISWRDDVVAMKNKAAAAALSGGLIGLTFVFCGANIGDGPGWWCVLFAGALGFVAFIVSGLMLNLFTDIFRRVTIGRNIGAGVRLAFYFLANGIILGRASGGDWTSFIATVNEFSVCWTAIPLLIVAILIERVFLILQKESRSETAPIPKAILCGIVYMFIAVAAVTMLPSIV